MTDEATMQIPPPAARPEGQDESQAGLRDIVAAMFGWRFALFALVAAVLVALAIGIPTDVVPNSWFTRMTPVRPEDYVFLLATALLSGVLLATYAPGRKGGAGAGPGVGSGLLGALAIGCPICNKLIVGLIGVSGALDYFAPIQPLLGLTALALVVAGLVLRLRELRAGCAVDIDTGGAGMRTAS